MKVDNSTGRVNTRPSKVVVFPGPSAREPNAPAEELVAAFDASAEMRYAEFLADSDDFVVGGVSESGNIDSTLYQWTGEFWAALPDKVAAAKAYRWLKSAESSKANKSLAYACLDTAVLEFIEREDKFLPDSRSRAIIPVRGAYLEIEKSGQVRVLAPDRKLGITYQVPATFDMSLVADDGTYEPRPVDPRSHWGQYLDRFMPDIAVRELLQEATASSLLPMCLEKGFFLLGSGSNGKSTFLHILRALHPKNTAIRVDKLDGQFAMNSLVGKTLAIATEMPKVLTAAVQEELKKTISRDPVEVEAKGRDPYTMVPRVTLFAALNEWFTVSGHEHGFWRKVLAIPFNVRLEEGSKDRVADFHKLIIDDPAEMAQVLNWILAGAVRLIQRGGFPSELPEAVVKLAEQNRQVSDTVVAYLNDREAVECELTQTCKKAVYSDYREFVLTEAGKKPVAAEEFWKRVRERMPHLTFKHLTMSGEKVRTAGIFLEGVKVARNMIVGNVHPSQARAGTDDVPA